MSEPVSIPSRPPLARSLLISLSVTFAACLIAFGLAVHFLIVAPATQSLARVQLDLATAHIQSEAERSFRRIEIQLGTARAWGQSGRLSIDDRAGFDDLMLPLLRDESRLGAIHLASTDGRRFTLSREGDAPCSNLDRTLPPTGLESSFAEGTVWSAPFLAPDVGDGCITVSTRWRNADGRMHTLTFDVSLAQLSRLTLETPVGERGGGTVLTAHGDIVGVPRYPRFANLSDQRGALLRPAAAANVDFLTQGHSRWLSAGQISGTIFSFENEGETWLARFIPLQLGEQRWWVAGFARETDFIPARLREVVPVLLFLTLMAGGLAIAIARRIARRLEISLAALVERSERIGRLDLSAPAPFDAPWRELAELGASQEHMRRRLQQASDDLLQSRAELEDKVLERTHQLAEKSEALSDQLLFIEVLLDALPSPVFYKGPDGRFLGCNRAYEQAFGTTRAFLHGKTVLELPYLPPADRVAYHEEDLRIIAEACTSHKETPIPFADGRNHDTLYWVRGFRLGNGEPGGLLGVIVDISAQKAAERAARAAEERSRQMLESSPIAVVINRPDGTPLFANTRALVLADTDMSTFMARPVTTWFRDPSAGEKAITRLKNGLTVRDMEIEFQNIAGHPFWTLMTMERTEVGGSPALISWSYDITARKLAERELRKLSLAVEQSPSMLLITTPGGAIQYANPRFCQVTGFSAERLAGTHPDLVDASGLPLEFLADQWQSLKSHGVWRRECQLRLRSGELLWVGISVSGLVEGDGEITHCIWALEDLALHRQAVETLREAKQLAEEAADSKARFLANMSHEIRTPLNAIIGLASLCLDTDMHTRQRDYVTKIHAAGITLLGVINDVLDFSKIEAGKLRLEQTTFALDRVLDSVITYVAQKAQEKGLELILQVAPDVPQDLLGDPLRLGQVLTNLLGNAVKFTLQGEVQLHVHCDRREGQHALLRFDVTDTGIGMSQDQVSRLFEAFSQADESMTRRFGGTGLGLSISRQLVELMGGKLDVSSTPGAGSRFSFNAAFDLAPGRAPRPLPGMLDGLRILVVDDHPVAREVLLHLLQTFPFRSEAVSSAAEAIIAVRRADAGDRFGLVLMDLRMPDQNGIEATRRIKQDRSLASPPAVILLTAYGEEGTAGEAVEAGADGFLHKPATASTLLDTIISTFGLDAAPPLPPSPTGDHVLAGLRILVAEDNEINQQIARGLLERIGATVSVADNGRIALETLMAAGPDAFDVVLMDLQMPEMDGLEATHRIRADARLANLPIIAMTAHAMAEERQRCVNAGMNDHVAKPIVVERLVQAILRHVRRTPPSQALREPPGPAPGEMDANGMPDLPGINVKSALRRVGNDPATYLSLLRRFATTNADCAERIGRALEADQTNEAERIAHSVRGAAANLGAGAIQEAANDLEMALRRGSPWEAALQSLATEITALTHMLETALPVQIDVPAPIPHLDAAALDESIATLIKLIEHSDGAAPAHFREIRNNLSARIGTEKVGEIAEALQHYDYDHALACLHEACPQQPPPPSLP
ncbi:response regulator [Zoogloea sp.]|uniref:response regulator n=1 Tax=Zoogloea sp. TaxID=49181 RepID=UPI0035B46026